MVDQCVKRIQKAQPGAKLTTKPPVFDDFLQVIADHIQVRPDQRSSSVAQTPRAVRSHFDVIQSVFSFRQSILALEDTEKRLEQLASQYRAVEKRLLAKTKDKTPSPFNNLDKLLEMTHHDVRIEYSLASSLAAVVVRVTRNVHLTVR